MAKGKDLISCRTVLWYMVFSGSAITYMLKINMNLVIVATVIPKKTRASVAQCAISNNSTITTNVTIMRNIVSSTMIHEELEYTDRFDWTEYEQGLMLGAFYWLFWAAQVPGGVLGRRYGAKRIFGGAHLLTSIICFILPFAMKFHLIGVVILRCLQGLIVGAMYPSMHGLPAKWVPPNERSRFVTAYMGKSIGTAITYPLCAIIIYYFNWESAFYVSSLLGFIWYVLWCYLVYDTPQEHPRISAEELEYIVTNTPAPIAEDKKRPVPWCSIITSMPLWITIAADWDAAWGFYTLLAQTPSYFNYIHGWSINMQTIEQWRWVFLIAAANLAVACIVYVLWGTS